MVDTLDFRPFEPEDLPRLHTIREAAFRPIFGSFRKLLGDEIAPVALANAEKEQAAHLDGLCDPDSGHAVHVVERDGEIVAFCAVSLDEDSKVGEIDLNAVHPDHQGKGIGAAMYRFALAGMRDAGMRVATVGTGGDASHAPARRAYQKAGFGPSIPGIYMYRAL